MDLRTCAGILLIIEVFIFGATWLMGYDLDVKEKVKIIIASHFLVFLIFLGVYLILT